MGQPGVRRSMFWRLWLRSLTVKRPQAALAVTSILVGAAVASMLLNLYGDAQRKMTQEFRAYGPNIVLAPAQPAEPAEPAGPPAASPIASGVNDVAAVAGFLDERLMDRLAPFAQGGNGIAAVPVLYAVVRVGKERAPDAPSRPENPENAIAAGTNFAALHRINPSWHVEGNAGASSGAETSCVVGAHVASRLGLSLGDSVVVEVSAPNGVLENSPRASYRVSSIVTTGTSEDDQVFVPLASLQRLGGLAGKVSLVELSVSGETTAVERALGRLNQALADFPGVEVRPIRQIVYSEGKVLDTIRGVMLSLTALILFIIALCVMATMTAIVLERRKDVAVMKSLGAGDPLVMRLFLTEGATLGFVGGAAGFGVGLALAHEMARRLFQANLSFVWWTLPVICISSMMLAVLATFFPMEIVRGIQPNSVLRGE
jgi:putative ABC transport system permease protein